MPDGRKPPPEASSGVDEHEATGSVHHEGTAASQHASQVADWVAFVAADPYLNGSDKVVDPLCCWSRPKEHHGNGPNLSMEPAGAPTIPFADLPPHEPPGLGDRVIPPRFETEFKSKSKSGAGSYIKAASSLPIPIGEVRFACHPSLNFGDTSKHLVDYSSEIAVQLCDHVKADVSNASKAPFLKNDIRLFCFNKGALRLVDIVYPCNAPDLSNLDLVVAGRAAVFIGYGPRCAAHHAVVGLSVPSGPHFDFQQLAQTLNDRFKPYAEVIDLWAIRYVTENPPSKQHTDAPIWIGEVCALIEVHSPAGQLATKFTQKEYLQYLPGYLRWGDRSVRLSFLHRFPHCTFCRADYEDGPTPFARHERWECTRAVCGRCRRPVH